MKTKILKYAVAPLLLIFASASYAAPVVSFNTASGGVGNENTQNVGWQFDVLTDFRVTALSWADLDLGGMGASHEIGIWNSAGTLLTSATIGAGTASTLSGIWRVEDIPDIILTAGTGYIVGGLNQAGAGDTMLFDVADLVVNSAISFVDATFSNFTNVFGRPTLFSVATNGFYGPSFEGEAVPEPSIILLFAAGLLGIGFARRRKA